MLAKSGFSDGAYVVQKIKRIRKEESVNLHKERHAWKFSLYCTLRNAKPKKNHVKKEKNGTEKKKAPIEKEKTGVEHRQNQP